MLQTSWVVDLGLQVQPFEQLGRDGHASGSIGLDLMQDVLGGVTMAVLIIDGLSGRLMVHGWIEVCSRVEVFANILRIHLVFSVRFSASGFVRIVNVREEAKEGEGWHSCYGGGLRDLLQCPFALFSKLFPLSTYLP